MAPNPNQVFSQFSSFPIEIQLKIWQYAAPDPRSIPSAINIILNLNLSRPLALLPSPNQLKQGSRIGESDLEERDDDGAQWGYWDVDNDEMMLERRPILNIMHACRNARSVARKTYILDLDSIVQDENEPLWTDPENDLVYFQLVGAKCPSREDAVSSNLERDANTAVAMLGFLSLHNSRVFEGHRYKHASCLSSIKHIAVRVNRAFHLASGFHNYVDWECRWLESFPELESFSLFFDPSNLHNDWDTGKIVLFEPFDYRVHLVAVRVSDYVAKVKADLMATYIPTPEHRSDTSAGMKSDKEFSVEVQAFVIERRRHKRARGSGC